MLIMKWAARFIGAVMGFVVTLALATVLLTFGTIISNHLSGYHGHPSPGPIGQMFIAAFMGLSVYGARLGWVLTRKWLP